MSAEQFTIPKRPGWGAGITVTIECDPLATIGVKLGLAVRVARDTGANLSGANLAGAYLTRANLTGANLAGANLDGANLYGATRLPTGETWAEYLAEVVPALLTAGGKSLEECKAHWECHTWSNCPMAWAFDCKGIEGVPILLRPRAQQFVQLFDAKLIPCPCAESVAP